MWDAGASKLGGFNFECARAIAEAGFACFGAPRAFTTDQLVVGGLCWCVGVVCGVLLVPSASFVNALRSLRTDCLCRGRCGRGCSTPIAYFEVADDVSSRSNASSSGS